MEIKEDDFIINAPGNYEDYTWYIMINSGEKYSFKGAHLKADEIKQQILDNQEIVQRLKKEKQDIFELISMHKPNCRCDSCGLLSVKFWLLKSILENKK